MGIIEALLCKLFPYTDIGRKDTGVLYLRRWFIYPRNKEMKLEPRIYLHKFYRGDEDPYLHDHPWPFTSLILTRGYWEETPFFSAVLGAKSWTVDKALSVFNPDGPSSPSLVQKHSTDPETRRVTFYPRFSLLRRPAAWQHRVILKDEKPVWTIVKTGVKERSWGFWVNSKLCPWRTFTEKGVEWCGVETSDGH